MWHFLRFSPKTLQYKTNTSIQKWKIALFYKFIYININLRNQSIWLMSKKKYNVQSYQTLRNYLRTFVFLLHKSGFIFFKANMLLSFQCYLIYIETDVKEGIITSFIIQSFVLLTILIARYLFEVNKILRVICLLCF